MVRGPIVHDEQGRRRALSSPRLTELVVALILTAAVMIALYTGLDGRNARLLANGASLFSPRLPFDDEVALVPGFVVAYYTYFPLLFFFAVITGRDRRLMYEGVIGFRRYMPELGREVGAVVLAPGARLRMDSFVGSYLRTSIADSRQAGVRAVARATANHPDGGSGGVRRR